MDKMFGKIQHKLGVEGTEPEGFKGGFRSDACKSILGTVVTKPANRDGEFWDMLGRGCREGD